MHALLSEFEHVVARQPDRFAACDQSLVLDYRALRAAAAALAERIQQATRQPHVGIMAPASSAGAAAIFACWYAGRIPVPLNFLLSPDELAQVIRDAGLDCVLTIERFAAQLAPTGVRPLVLDARTLAPTQTGSAAARERAAAGPPPADARDVGAIIYTSGTSGAPKGVCLSFDNLVQNARACIAHARISPDQVFLSVVPQFHSFGFTTMTVTPLVLGATVWYLPRFSPVAVVGTIAEKKVTVFLAVASMYAALARMKDADPAALASLRLAISGGEPLAPGVAQTFRERFGVEILDGYGLTEAAPVVSVNMPWAQRPGSVGRPLPGVTVVAADQAGRVLPPGQEGELLVSGHGVMRGYHNQPQATALAIRDGRLHTGDVGRVDADGFVYITGRLKEMMIVGGENVFPIEIENVLLAHPDVLEAAVIGVPDKVRGQVPAAFVILHEGATADEVALRAFCRQHLAGYKVPREIRIERELPRGPTGKILKRALKSALAPSSSRPPR